MTDWKLKDEVNPFLPELTLVMTFIQIDRNLIKSCSNQILNLDIFLCLFHMYGMCVGMCVAWCTYR